MDQEDEENRPAWAVGFLQEADVIIAGGGGWILSGLIIQSEVGSIPAPATNLEWGLKGKRCEMQSSTGNLPGPSLPEAPAHLKE